MKMNEWRTLKTHQKLHFIVSVYFRPLWFVAPLMPFSLDKRCRLNVFSHTSHFADCPLYCVLVRAPVFRQISLINGIDYVLRWPVINNVQFRGNEDIVGGCWSLLAHPPTQEGVSSDRTMKLTQQSHLYNARVHSCKEILGPNCGLVALDLWLDGDTHSVRKGTPTQPP